MTLTCMTKLISNGTVKFRFKMSREDSPLETRHRQGNRVKTDLELREVVNYIQPVVFRLSPCSECSLCSFGNFPGVRSIKADISDLNVGSIVLGDQE